MFDGGVFIGRNPINGNELTEEQCIDWMDEQGIHCSIVSHYKSIFFDFREGNSELLNFAKKYPDRIIPSVIVSLKGFDISEAEKYFDELIKQGARVLGVYRTPKYYDVPLNSLLLRRVVDIASSKGLIIQFGLESASDLNNLWQYFSHIDTTVLIRWMNGRGYSNLAEILAVVKSKRNFYFDIGAVNNCRGIQYLVEKSGSNRYFWASGKPECFYYTSRFLISSEDLSEANEQNILDRTLRNLIRISTDSELMKKVLPDEWAHMMKRAKVDTHWHFHGWNLVDTQNDIQAIHGELEKYSFEKIVFSSSLSLNYDIQKGNSELSKILDEDISGKLYGYIVIDPTQIEKSLLEIERYRDHPRFVGLKTIQDLYGMKLDDHKYGQIFALGEKYNMTILAHIPGMKEAAINFPKMKFIAAHSTWERIKHLIDVENIYFDLCTSHNDWAETQLIKFVQAVGAHRVLFGSDGQLISPAWTLGKIYEYSLDEKLLAGILRNNAYELLPKLKG